MITVCTDSVRRPQVCARPDRGPAALACSLWLLLWVAGVEATSPGCVTWGLTVSRLVEFGLRTGGAGTRTARVQPTKPWALLGLAQPRALQKPRAGAPCVRLRA